jgi:Mrp family chromosome partitioning ATPase
LFPLAASLLQYFGEAEPKSESAEHLPRALLLEAAGPECGLSDSLGLETIAGLSDILESGASWKSAIEPTWHPQVALLGRGTEPIAASHGRLPELFKDLSDNFDIVLIATGSSLPASDPDLSIRNSIPQRPSAALALAPLAAAGVLCVELNGTPSLFAADVKRNLEASGIDLIGCVVQGDATAA